MRKTFRSLVLGGSFALVGSPFALAAKPAVSIFTGNARTTSATWEITTDAGCTQLVGAFVTSRRSLTVDTSTHTVLREVNQPTLVVNITQLDAPGCEGFGISSFVDNLSRSQFSRNGLGSARVDVDDVVLSDPLAGVYVLDVHLRWTGTGKVTTAPTQERFCDETGVCFVGVNIDQTRAAKLSGSLTATITPLFGPIVVEDYSPSAGTNASGFIEQTNTVTVTKFPAP